jgi:hypothetical protein
MESLAVWDASTTPPVGRPAMARTPWFSHVLELSPSESGWYAVEVEGSQDMAPVLPGATPWAHSSALFVDLL